MAQDEPLAVGERDNRVTFDVRVTPRASRNAIVGAQAGVLRVSLTAPPVEGEANAALVALIAHTLSVPKRAIHIVRGERSRTKTVAVEGVTGAYTIAALSNARLRTTRR